jgi:hypothetical protein
MNRMILKLAVFKVGECIASLQWSSLQPFSVSPGFGVGAPGQSSPVLMLPNPMITPVSTVALPMLPSSYQIPSGSVGMDVGQIQTTLLRGSSPLKHAEPILPRTLPSPVPYERKSPVARVPEIFISPRNLEIIHHHRLQIPETSTIKEAGSAPPVTESRQQAVVEEQVKGVIAPMRASISVEDGNVVANTALPVDSAKVSQVVQHQARVTAEDSVDESGEAMFDGIRSTQDILGGLNS